MGLDRELRQIPVSPGDLVFETAGAVDRLVQDHIVGRGQPLMAGIHVLADPAFLVPTSDTLSCSHVLASARSPHLDGLLRERLQDDARLLRHGDARAWPAAAALRVPPSKGEMVNQPDVPFRAWPTAAGRRAAWRPPCRSPFRWRRRRRGGRRIGRCRDPSRGPRERTRGRRRL